MRSRHSMSSTECPSRSSPAVTICATLTTKSNRLLEGHSAPARSDAPAEPQISAVRGGASLVLQGHILPRPAAMPNRRPVAHRSGLGFRAGQKPIGPVLLEAPHRYIRISTENRLPVRLKLGVNFLFLARNRCRNPFI